jgi:hypothetical protein
MLVLSEQIKSLGRFCCTLADNMTRDIKEIWWNVELDSSGSRGRARGQNLRIE